MSRLTLVVGDWADTGSVPPPAPEIKLTTVLFMAASSCRDSVRVAVSVS